MDADLALDRLIAGESEPLGDHVLAATLRLAVARQPHRGSYALGMIDVVSVLWSRFLRFDSGDAHWPDRDRFVVSAARFAPVLRALLTLTAEADAPEAADDQLLDFGQHPGVEMAIGPAGQGIATAAGMAAAERILAARFGHSLVDHRSWVLACETDLSAGVALEAAALAGQMRLERLTVLFELDGGAAGASASTPAGDAQFGPMARFAACGWSVRRVDAHDPEAVAQAIAGAMRGRRPSLIACVVRRQTELDAELQAGPEVVPEAWREAWRACGRRGNPARRGWLKRLVRHRHHREFERVTAGRLPAGWRRSWREAWQQPDDDEPGGQTPPAAEHDVSGACRGPDISGARRGPDISGARRGPDISGARRGLDALLTLLPEFVSLSCEPGLPSMPPLGAPRSGRIGRSLSLGTQEHGMAALLNGIALHGGLLPCGSASFISVDRMRPALRLGALMGRQVIHLLTHDGLALGEDGAAWQPVEQLASLRAMPNLAVFRPADGTEMMECWQLALHRTEGPSLIAFSSRIPPSLRDQVRLRGASGTIPVGNACARGGYVLADAPDERVRDVTLIATGPEVMVAVAARDRLMQHGIAAAIVSLPCWELFSAQSTAYREAILGKVPRIGIEAASGFGWERWLGDDGVFIGIDDFGVSAPADELYRRFGLTPEAVTERVRRRLRLRPWPSGQQHR